MPGRQLAGRPILLVEDEPLVAIDVERRAAGARVICAGFVESGLFTTEHPDLSGAVIDLHLGRDGNGAAVCRRLRQLGAPFVVHTGYPVSSSMRSFAWSTDSSPSQAYETHLCLTATDVR
jgi:ActR/RegA family two-component response regulator